MGDTPPLSTYATSYAYDALSRVLSVTAPGGAITGTVYTDNTYRVTDPALVVRKVTLDALGRLASVQENPDAVTPAGPTTTYTYNWGDHLL